MQGFCCNPDCKRLIYDVEDESHLSVNDVIECQHCHTINENPRYKSARDHVNIPKRKKGQK